MHLHRRCMCKKMHVQVHCHTCIFDAREGPKVMRCAQYPLAQSSEMHPTTLRFVPGAKKCVGAYWNADISFAYVNAKKWHGVHQERHLLRNASAPTVQVQSSPHPSTPPTFRSSPHRFTSGFARQGMHYVQSKA